MDAQIDLQQEVEYNGAMPRPMPELDLKALCLDLEDATGYSPVEMAECLGANLQAYYRWRTGKRTPDGKFTAKLFLLLREIEKNSLKKIPLTLK